MKAVVMVVGATILILLAPAVMLSIDSFRLAEVEEDHIVTTSGATTASITLSNELYNDHIYNATATSNVTGDAPIPTSYTSATRALVISGLLDNTSHRLSLTYQIDGLEDFWGAQLGARTLMLFLILGIIGVIVGAVYTATRGGE